MPAPANDNWASATVITGLTGNQGDTSTPETNTLSTAQVGEPANNGKTVWYKWVAPSFSPPTSNPGTYFTTLYNPAAVAANPWVVNQLKTVLQVFTGSAVNALTEVTYIGKNWTQRYGNWDFGSHVQFNAVAGTTYYIRVDGVAGEEGDFVLSWGQQENVVYGACDACPPLFQHPGYLCQGPVTVANAQGGPGTNYTSFGTFPAGDYVVLYCRGSQLDTVPPDFIIRDVVIPAGTVDFQVAYDSSGSVAAATFGSVATDTNLTNDGSVSKAGVEDINWCASASFHHDASVSGDISMAAVLTGIGFGSYGGTDLPVFCLYQITVAVEPIAACASWTVVGTSAQVYFQVHNFNFNAWNSVTCTLLGGGGVSSPSGTQTLNLAANSDSASIGPFTFNASNTNVTATLRLTCASFPAPGYVDIPFYLGPQIVTDLSVSVLNSPVGNCGGNPAKPSAVNSVKFINLGWWTVFANYTITASNGIQFLDGSCNVLSSLSGSGFELDCSTGGTPSNFLIFHTKRPAVSTPTVFTVTLSDASGGFGTLVIPYTMTP